MSETFSALAFICGLSLVIVLIGIWIELKRLVIVTGGEELPGFGVSRRKGKKIPQFVEPGADMDVEVPQMEHSIIADETHSGGVGAETLRTLRKKR